MPPDRDYRAAKRELWLLLICILLPMPFGAVVGGIWGWFHPLKEKP